MCTVMLLYVLLILNKLIFNLGDKFAGNAIEAQCNKMQHYEYGRISNMPLKTTIHSTYIT